MLVASRTIHSSSKNYKTTLHESVVLHWPRSIRQQRSVVTGFPVRPSRPELAQRYADQGWWTPRHPRGSAGTRSQRQPHGHVQGPFQPSVPIPAPSAMSRLLARRLAAGLRARGVGPGDVVAFQLPNWMEAAATFWASAFLSAVVVPIVHFYGPKELGYILATVKPRVFITTDGFGRMTYRPQRVCRMSQRSGSWIPASMRSSTPSPCRAPWPPTRAGPR